MPSTKMPWNSVQTNPAVTDAQGGPWAEFARVYPLYVALTRQCDLAPPPYAAGVAPGPWPDRKTMDRDLSWLQATDRQTQAVDLRQLLATPSAKKEESLRAFLQRQLLKPDKILADRDKIDLLVVQYFALCAAPELIAAGLDLSNVASVLRPVLGDVEAVSLECCEPLDRILAAAEKCRGLHEFVDLGLMDQGRIAKEAAGGMFYDPAALVSFCRFNFLFRRVFIQLLHSELRAINEALIDLERRGIKTVDCRRSGFSAGEPILKLREFQQRWKAPFQTDYTHPGAFRSYDQLLTLRADLDDELARGAAFSLASALSPVPALRDPASPSGSTGAAPKADAESWPAAQATTGVSQTSGGAQSSARIPEPALSVDECEEGIWEQLIATPPVRGRSMTTITLRDTRVLLSAWEVAAFVSDSGPDSEEIRRAIVARTMLAMAVDRRKRFLDLRVLHGALMDARQGIPGFQEHIEQLKRAKKVESAVNLGITLKRLLSVVEEAEQLQQGGSSEEKR